MAIIAEQGLDGLSLRDVARRLGVSHQAPYKHFESRDHILAEIVSRAYADFASYLDKRTRGKDPYDDLGKLGFIRKRLEGFEKTEDRFWRRLKFWRWTWKTPATDRN